MYAMHFIMQKIVKTVIAARGLLAATGVFVALATTNANSQPAELKPNLQPLPAFDISLERDVFGRAAIRFGATTWNSGDGPLHLLAGETGQDSTGHNRQNVYQVIQLSDGSNYQRLAGTFVWHPEHNHFHLENYADYVLQPLGAKGKSRRSGSKTSFCLMDTYAMDTSLPDSPTQPFFSDCDRYVQGISVGWADEYVASLPGQAIVVDDLKKGDYQLIIQADPKNRLQETNENDNLSCVLLHMDPVRMELQVLNDQSCDASAETPTGDLLLTSLTPDSGARGTLVPVTISGQGFYAGMRVELQNGSGPSPAVGELTIIDAQTATALITVKKGGGNGTSTWDLRVGQAVLPGAFTVGP